MDYKYIEQLLEHYFQGQTSQQEEQILKAFFAQDEHQVPAPLRQWQPLFAALDTAGEDFLGDDFDQRMLAMTEEPARVKARTISLTQRLRPLLKAAAVVAILLTLGNAMDLSLRSGDPAQGDDINYAAYKDTYDDPSMAFDKVEDALQLLSEGFSQVQRADTMKLDSLYSEVK